MILWIYTFNGLRRHIQSGFPTLQRCGIANFYPKLMKNRSSHQRCFVTQSVIRNFAKFTGNTLRQSHFFNKVAGLKAHFLQNASGRLLLQKLIILRWLHEIATYFNVKLRLVSEISAQIQKPIRY